MTFDRVHFRAGFRAICFYDSTTLLTGDIDFDVSYDIAAWVSTIIIREYKIITKTGSGILLEDIELRLVDQNNTVVWKGKADSLGQADFNVTFTGSNYTDTMRLEAAKGNYSAITNVNFLSDTPVILTLATHDLALTKLEPYKNITSNGTVTSVMATVANQGDVSETFSITLYCNGTVIETRTITLVSKESRILVFKWNPTGPPGIYLLRAETTFQLDAYLRKTKKIGRSTHFLFNAFLNQSEIAHNFRRVEKSVVKYNVILSFCFPEEVRICVQTFVHSS